MAVPEFVKVAKKYVTTETMEESESKEDEIFRLARKLEIYAAKKGD